MDLAPRLQPNSARRAKPKQAIVSGPEPSLSNGPSLSGKDVLSGAAQQLLQPSPRRISSQEQASKDSLKGRATAVDMDWSFILDSKKSTQQAAYTEVGPLMMRADQKAFKDHGAKGTSIDTRFMSAEDLELHTICETIGQKAAMKYKNVRQALRFMDADRDGWIARSEVSYFLRAYDVSSETAGARLCDILDPKRVGEIEYKAFVDYIGPYIRGEPPSFAKAVDADVPDSPKVSETSPLGKQEKLMPSGTAAPTSQSSPFTQRSKITMRQKHVDVASNQRDWNVDDWLAFLGRKSSERFRHVMDLIRHLDRDYDGSISREEMRHFFSIFGLDIRLADRCFAALLKSGMAEVDYMDFMRAIAPHLDLPGVEAVLHQGGGAGGKRIPVKQRMGQGVALTIDDDLELRTEEQKAALARRQGIRNLRLMMQDISRKLQLKFRHARDAFRGLDLDKDGKISPTEMRAFLRGFGYPAEAADDLFALLDEESTGEVDFSHFMSCFDQVVMQATAAKGQAAMFSDRHLVKDVAEVARIVGEKLFFKYRKVIDAFRMLDLNGDGAIDREEMRAFFRSINMPLDKADKLFQALDTDLTGHVQYAAFMGLMGPLIVPSGSGQNASRSPWHVAS